MKYYELSTFNRRDAEFCRLKDYPADLGLNSWRFAKGVELRPGDYPENAQIRMSDEDAGIRVPDIVPNTINLLICSRRVKEVIERVNQGQILAVTILNHRGRPASTEHFIIHPCPPADVLDRNASEVEIFKDTVIGIDKMVFDPKLLARAPALFRLQEEPHRHFISERLLEEIRALDPKPSNLSVEEIEQSPGG